MTISAGLSRRGKTLKPVVRDAGRVQPGDLSLAAHLHHLQLAHDGVAVDRLVEPQQPVGHREHGAVVLAFAVLAEEKGGGLVAGEHQREALHEVA